MGERVQIARQDTLLEVQTTGVQTKNTLDVVNGKIGNFGDTAEEETLFGQLAGGSGSSGAVKSVQRGIINNIPQGYGKISEIPINTVNPEKCIVIINTGTILVGNSYSGDSAILVDLLPDLLKIGSSRNNSGGDPKISWQVVEFF